MGLLILAKVLYFISLISIKFIFWFLYAGVEVIDSFFKFLVRWEVKANRRTATGILRAYFEKNNIADGGEFEILDYRKFLAEEKEDYRRQCGIEVFHDYGKFSKYVKKKYLKRN